MRHHSLIAAASIVAACQPASVALTDADKSAVVEELAPVLEASWEAWRAVDYDSGMSFYLDSPETVFTSQGATIRGFAAINEAFRPAFANIEQQEIDLTETHITVLSVDAVHVTESGMYAQFDGTDVELRRAPFSFSATWVRNDGEWRIITCHQSEQQQ
jgi:uncharacterized protein (TIGR02246 family)